MNERQVQALPITDFVDLFDQDDEKIAMVFKYDGGEIGLLVSPSTADEVTGALIERPQSGYRGLGSSDGRHVDVESAEVRQVEEDAYEIRIASEQSDLLTLRMGSRRVRRLRDTLTAHLVRHEAKKSQ